MNTKHGQGEGMKYQLVIYVDDLIFTSVVDEVDSISNAAETMREAISSMDSLSLELEGGGYLVLSEEMCKRASFYFKPVEQQGSK